MYSINRSGTGRQPQPLQLESYSTLKAAAGQATEAGSEVGI